MYFFEKPEIIQADTVFRLPESFRKAGGRTAWSDPNRLGAEAPLFLKVRHSTTPAISIRRHPVWANFSSHAGLAIANSVCEYDGRANGLKI